MSKKLSQVRMHANGRLAVKRGPARIAADAQLTHADLENMGIGIQAMDAALTGPAKNSGAIPGEMLQTWLPGAVRVITTARNIDQIIGITTVGNWEDDTINLRVLESVGNAELYGDSTNIPLASYNPSTESRGVVRFEQGFMTGPLEEARQSAAGYEAQTEKRRAANESLDLSRNIVGFNGFQSSTTNCYGLLNDPNLSAYKSMTAAWLTATYAQLTADFATLASQIETQMGGNLDDGAAMVFVLPTGYRSIMDTENTTNGRSFREWLDNSYPNLRIVYTPEFKDANGGADVVYLFVENAGADQDDDANTASAIQAVPVRYQVLGSENRIKGYVEDAINATAGVIVLRPWAFARMTVSA